MPKHSFGATASSLPEFSPHTYFGRRAVTDFVGLKQAEPIHTALAFFDGEEM